jgi:hypothetical protein
MFTGSVKMLMSFCGGIALLPLNCSGAVITPGMQITTNALSCSTLGANGFLSDFGCEATVAYSPSTYAYAFTNPGVSFVSANTIGVFAVTEVNVSSSIPNNASTASANISFSDQFYVVDGPVRQGFVEISTHSFANLGATSAWSFSFNGFTIITGSCNPTVCSNLTNYWIPVTLGAGNFQFAASSQSALSAGYNAININSSGDSDVSLSFFEADGATPVAISEIPEPSCWAIFGLGLGIVGVATRARRWKLLQ